MILTFYDFSMRFWNCLDSFVFFVFILLFVQSCYVNYKLNLMINLYIIS